MPLFRRRTVDAGPRPGRQRPSARRAETLFRAPWHGFPVASAGALEFRGARRRPRWLHRRAFVTRSSAPRLRPAQPPRLRPPHRLIHTSRIPGVCLLTGRVPPPRRTQTIDLPSSASKAPRVGDDYQARLPELQSRPGEVPGATSALAGASTMAGASASSAASAVAAPPAPSPSGTTVAPLSGPLLFRRAPLGPEALHTHFLDVIPCIHVPTVGSQMAGAAPVGLGAPQRSRRQPPT